MCILVLGFMDFQDLGFRDQGFVGVLKGFQGLQDLRFFKVQDLGFRVQGLVYLQVQGFMLRFLSTFLRFRALGRLMFFKILQVYGLGLRFFLCFQGLAYTIYGFIGFRSQSFLDLGVFEFCSVKCFLRFFRVQGFGLRVFVVQLWFTVYRFLEFRVQSFGFCRDFKWYLGFLGLILGFIGFMVS